jgi:pimeloyl-ACP methyl ester carboxylesterase
VSALASPSLMRCRASTRWANRQAVARAGFRVLRFELSGAGDSEGEDHRNTDFAAEAADNRAALNYLRSRADIDAGRIFVWGHSTGGMIAAILASSEDLAGLCVSSTIGRNMYERVAGTVRRQGELAGLPPAEVESRVVAHLKLLGALASGATAAELAADPALSRFVNAAGRIHDNRTVAYWRQQLELDLVAIYGGVSDRSHRLPRVDFTLREDHELIARVLRAAGNAHVRSRSPRHGHAFARRGLRQASPVRIRLGPTTPRSSCSPGR